MAVFRWFRGELVPLEGIISLPGAEFKEDGSENFVWYVKITVKI